MRDVSDDTDPFVTAPCEGIAPGGWQCMNLIQEDGHLLEAVSYTHLTLPTIYSV